MDFYVPLVVVVISSNNNSLLLSYFFGLRKIIFLSLVDRWIYYIGNYSMIWYHYGFKKFPLTQEGIIFDQKQINE